MMIENVKKLQEQNLELLKKKNHDYTGNRDEYANLRLCEVLWVISLEKWIIVRLCDKLSRISSLIDHEEHVKTESIIDTLQDMSNYALILASYILDKKEIDEECRKIEDGEIEYKERMFENYWVIVE